jgi:tetratricopeptide (TPR) repeat protein
MLKHEQDEKTVILSIAPEQVHETTALVYEPHKIISKNAGTKGHKTRILRILLIMAVTFSVAALCVYVLYEQRNQRLLTDKLMGSLHQGSLKQAQEIMSEIKKHGYASDSIAVLEKELINMKELSDKWDKVRQYYSLGMYKEARNALVSFTSNTSYHDRALVLLENMKTKELNDMLKSAGSLYANGNGDKASALIHHVLEIDPSNHDAKALLAMMKPAAPVRRIKMRAIKNQIENTGDTAYKKGDYDTAVRLWANTHSNEDSKKLVIAANRRKYISIGKKAFESGDYSWAIKCFDKVQAFIDLLGIHGSMDEHTARRYLSMSYSSLGKQAITDGLYKQASIYFKESFKFDPFNAEAVHGVSVLNKEAERLYKTGYMISNANIPEACRLYNRALDIASKDTDVYKKVKEHIIICKP